MNDFPPGAPLDPDKPKGPSTMRITIWIVVGAIGLYMVVSGVIGGITAGA